MKTFGIITCIFLLIVGTVALAFALELGGLEWDRYFGPKKAEVQREVFKEGRSYNEAKSQALVKHYREYLKADDDDKAALAGLIRVEFAEFYADGKADDLPANLRDFLRDVMEN